MKKILCMLLITAMVLSMMPFAVAANSEPEPVSTETFAYTQGDVTVTEEVKLYVEPVPAVEDAAGDALKIDTEIETEKALPGKESEKETTKETDASIVDDKQIMTQKLSDNSIIKTVTDEVDCAIEGGDEECEHFWGEGEVVTPGSCHEHGVKVQICSKCGAVKTTLTEMSHYYTLVRDVGCAPTRYHIYECELCNEVRIEYDNSITSTDHNYKNNICTVCGDVAKTSGTIITGEKDSVAAGPKYSYESGTLIIDGEGEIPDYKISYEVSKENNNSSEAYVLDVPLTKATPWADYANKILYIHIRSGIKRIGDFAFANLFNLIGVKIFGKDTEIGDYAFANDSRLDTVDFYDKNATAVFDNPASNVTYNDSNGNASIAVGSTAFARSGNVSVNYICINPNASSYKTSQKFAYAGVSHNDLHINCKTIPGYAPTETEFGLTDGLYCDDCQKFISSQSKIYPNGKEETGEYKINELSKQTGVPEVLNGTKFNTAEKLALLTEEYNKTMRKEFKEQFNVDLSEQNSKIYNIELVKSFGPAIDCHVINIPYPAGTTPDKDEFLVVQLDTKTDKIETIDTFYTNKGIQIEVEELMPVGVAWKNK